MKGLFVVGLFTLGFVSSALAAESAYSKVDVKTCKQTSFDEESGSVTFSCPGKYGIDVWFAEGDLRQFLAYGPDPRTQCVSRQTFGNFNTAGPTLEWRSEGSVPFATIVRYHMDSSDGSKFNYLVVTTLQGDEACHIGYVDGALPNHNEIARQIADDTARGFNCATDMPVFMTGHDHTINIVSGVPCGPN